MQLWRGRYKVYGSIEVIWDTAEAKVKKTLKERADKYPSAVKLEVVAVQVPTKKVELAAWLDKNKVGASSFFGTASSEQEIEEDAVAAVAAVVAPKAKPKSVAKQVAEAVVRNETGRPRKAPTKPIAKTQSAS